MSACLCGSFGFVYEFETVEQAVNFFEFYLYEDEIVEGIRESLDRL